MYLRLLLVAVILLASCIDERKYDFQQVTVSPTLAFPVAFGDLGIVEILSNKDTAYVRSYPDGLLYLFYEKTLPSRDIRDLFSLPNVTSTTSFNLPAGTLPASNSSTLVGTVDRQVDLNLSPEQLTEILLKGGTAAHALLLSKQTSPPGLPLEATITLLDVIHKVTTQPLTMTVGNGAGSVSLTDYVMRLVNNRFAIRISLSIKPHPTTYIPPSTQANVQLGFNNMEFDYIKGFFGDQATTLPAQTVDRSVFRSTLKDASVSFVEPQLFLKAVNEYGIPCEVTFSVLRARKGSSTLPIQTSPASPVALAVPSVLGGSATTTMNVTNAQAIMNFEPEQLEYTVAARINKGLASGSNFMADTSKLTVSMVTEVPLYGRVTGITVTDTLAVDLNELSETKVSEASLKVTARNEMPLDANIQIYLMNESFQVLDSLFGKNQTYLVKASQVDGAGDLKSPGITNLDLTLEPARVTKLFSSRYLLVKSVMSTARDANDVFLNVKFRSSYRLKLNVGMRAKLKIELK